MNQLVVPGSVPGITDLEVNDTNGLSAHVTYPEWGADSVHCCQPDTREISRVLWGKCAAHWPEHKERAPEGSGDSTARDGLHTCHPSRIFWLKMPYSQRMPYPQAASPRVAMESRKQAEFDHMDKNNQEAQHQKHGGQTMVFYQETFAFEQRDHHTKLTGFLNNLF